MSLREKLHVLVVDDMATSRGLITQALEEIGLAPNLFEPWKKLCRGTRRPLMMRALALSVTRVEEGLWVEFSLPAGAYATTILREFTGSSVELQGPA